MSDKQRTITKTFTMKGSGIHTGVDVELTFIPAPVNHGFKFRRIDLDNKPVINAWAENVIDTSRGTTLEENGATIATIEHVLAALTGMGVDNVMMEINGPEMPIMDGSSKYFVNELKEIGTVEQEEDRKYFEITDKISFTDEEHGIELVAYPDDHYSIDVKIDYNSKVLGNQYATLKKIDDFAAEISACRTFAFLHEIEFLAKNNLIKGGDLTNAIVIIDREVSQDELDRLADLFNKPKVKVKPEGILNNLELHFQNEPDRHKLLDVVGDLALAGMRIKGKIIATKPGHYANTEFAKKLRKTIKKKVNKPTSPKYNPAKKPLYGIAEIQERIPHRSPFLFVDKILEMDEKSVTAIKNVTMSEAHFAGHFPDEPVMPGVLQVEAIAQAGAILLTSTVDNPEDYLTYFLKIEEVKFKQKVVPGDTLVMQLFLSEPIKRGIGIMKGQAFVGETLVMEALLMAQLAKKTKK